MQTIHVAGEVRRRRDEKSHKESSQLFIGLLFLIFYTVYKYPFASP